MDDLIQNIADGPSPAHVAAGFDQRQPWITRFNIGGVNYGGTTDLMHDSRVRLFPQTWPPPMRVLELGSLEGAHSFSLAQHGYEVTAVEGRAANLSKAQFVQGLLGLDVSFIQANLEDVPLTHFGRFDAIFCSGLLYHLPEPWRLLEQFGDVAPRLLLWTHYTDTPTETRMGYRGTPYIEHGVGDSLSGMSSTSFWLTKDEILALLEADGWVIKFLDEPEGLYHEYGPRILLTAELEGA